MRATQRHNPITLGVLNEIQKRRTEPTVEGIGKNQWIVSMSTSTLAGRCLLSIIENIEDHNIDRLVETLPLDIRMNLFEEISKNFRDRQTNKVLGLLKGGNVRYLRLASKNIDDEGLSIISTVCPLLEIIYLRPCTITLAGVLDLVRGCKNLVSIDLGWTVVFDHATKDQVVQFFSSLNPNFEHLCMRGTSLRWLDLRIDLISEYCQNIRSLNIGKIKSLDIAVLKKIFQKCQKISELILDLLNITDNDLPHIMSLLDPKNLTTLDLSMNSIGDTGLEHVATLCPNLEKLLLKNLTFGDQGLTAIAEKCKKIRVLDLGGCYEVTDIGIIQIAKNGNLQEINLEGLSCLTEKSVEEVLTNCKNLRSLEIPDSNMSKQFRERCLATKQKKRIPPFVY